MATRPSLARLTDASLASRAKDLIRAAIFDGKIRPEQRLTIERIADELGISRTPVREALKALESDGVVQLLPRRGAIVASYSRQEIFDRYTIRAMVEGHAGALACERQSKTLAKDLRRDCETLARLIAEAAPEIGAVRPLIEANATFHGRILKASGSTTSSRVLDTLTMPVAYRVFIWQALENRQRSLRWHERIAEAFAARRADEVRQLMQDHLIEARDFLISIDEENDSKTRGDANGASSGRKKSRAG